jgi:hypothetical protein
MMKFDYSKMEFDPTVKKLDGRVKAIIGCDNERILRYILLMYDKNSPIPAAYQSLQQRKEMAASIAGYDLMKDNVAPLFEFKKDEESYDELIGWISNYLRYQNNLLWCLIVSQEQAFHEFTSRVMMPVTGDKDKDILSAVNIKNSIMSSQDDIITRLDKYYRQLSGGDEVLETQIKSRKRFTPETVMNV